MALVTFTPNTKIVSADLNANFSGLADASLITAGAIPFSKLEAAAWTAFTPTWATSGTAPVLGNGTFYGRYAKVGRQYFVTERLTMGSTTTFGTTGYLFSLPNSATAANLNVYYEDFRGTYYDASTSAEYPITGRVQANGTTIILSVGHTGTTANHVDQFSLTGAVPVTMDTSDVVSISGWFEATA